MSSNLQLRSLSFITLTALTLNACGAGGTRDIEAIDSGTFVGSVGFEKELSDRGAYEFGYVANRGKTTQEVGYSGVQFNGTRFQAPVTLKNDYNFHTLTWNYKYNFFNGDRFKMFIAPGVSLHFANLDSEIQADTQAGAQAFLTNVTHNKTYPGYGVKLGASVNLSNDLSLTTELAVYDLRAQKHLETGGIWLAYNTSTKTQIKLGTSFVGLFNDITGDGCYGDTIENCRDSELQLETTGLHVGVLLRR